MRQDGRLRGTRHGDDVDCLLAVVLPALQTETAQATTMQSDVDRLVRAAEGLAGTWPSQPNQNRSWARNPIAPGARRSENTCAD